MLNWISEKAKAAKEYAMERPKTSATVAGTAVVMAYSVYTAPTSTCASLICSLGEKLAATGLTAAATAAVVNAAAYGKNYFAASTAPQAEVAPAEKSRARSPAARGRKAAPRVEEEVVVKKTRARSKSRGRK